MRIGLALSGGGFRAAIFHLGVIRRLEELGIMKDVDVMSTVSGGSIIGAYYLCEMEQHIRDIPASRQHDPALRLQLFERIAADFLSSVDENLRTRALIFTPFYHPLLFVKTLFFRAFRASARSELIQAEYDRCFYDDNTLDHLPAVTSDQTSRETSASIGPKLVLNTTSLLTGERVSFSREPVSGIQELSKVNRNVLPLSRVVGASSGVPVLFPPTSIAGDLLVDGGVSDNQGVCPLLDGEDECDFLIISDAAGQLEQSDSMRATEVSVYARTNAILMHQVREKVVRLLCTSERPFAFVHLFLNLKDRPEAEDRVSSEFIPAIARLRTDLDQFSVIEQEALMYHGYTLIDAQLRRHCLEFLRSRGLDADPPPLLRSPLFREDVQRSAEARKLIRRDLQAGGQNLYLLRCFEKYGWQAAALWAAFEVAAMTILVWVLSRTRMPLVHVRRYIEDGLLGTLPAHMVQWLDAALRYFGMESLSTMIHDVSGLLSVVVMLLATGYVATFPAYNLIRRLTLRKDRAVYRAITNQDPTIAWDKSPAPEAQAKRAAAD